MSQEGKYEFDKSKTLTLEELKDLLRKVKAEKKNGTEPRSNGLPFG
jgi:hypothetical protein